MIELRQDKEGWIYCGRRPFWLITFVLLVVSIVSGCNDSVEQDAQKLSDIMCRSQSLNWQALHGGPSTVSDAQQIQTEAAALKLETQKKYTSESDKQRFSAAFTKAQSNCVPPQEDEFCSILENATSKYGALDHERSAARDQNNGIRVQQFEGQMTSVRQKRDEEVFQMAKRIKFSVENWLFTIVKIGSPDENCHTNMPSCVFVDVHPVCSPTTIIHAMVPAPPRNLQFLATKQQNDRLVLSGILVERFGGATAAKSPVIPSSSKEFEGSFTESGSMSEPEYNIDVTTLR